MMGVSILGTTACGTPARDAASPAGTGAARESGPTGTLVDGGVWTRRLAAEGQVVPETFMLLADARYGWMESATPDEPAGPNNVGPGYLRRGNWHVEGAELVLEETWRKVYDEATAAERVEQPDHQVRRLPLASCDPNTPPTPSPASDSPKATGCLVIDGIPFWRIGDAGEAAAKHAFFFDEAK